MSLLSAAPTARFGDGKFAPMTRDETRLREPLRDEQAIEAWINAPETPEESARIEARYRGETGNDHAELLTTMETARRFPTHRATPRSVPAMPRAVQPVPRAPAPLLAAQAVAAHLLVTTERRGHTVCDHRLFDEPTGPKCERTSPHDPARGCSYVSSDGSFADDTRADGGHG